MESEKKLDKKKKKEEKLRNKYEKKAEKLVEKQDKKAKKIEEKERKKKEVKKPISKMRILEVIIAVVVIFSMLASVCWTLLYYLFLED